MASQACSASANVLKGDPIILMAGLLISMGRQEATKPGRPCSPGPLMLSLLITNEKPHSLALHISNSSFAASIRLKCRAISQSGVPQTAPGRPQGPPTCGRSLPAKVWERGPEVGIRRLATPGVPTIATFSRHSGGRLTKRKRGPGANTHLGCLLTGNRPARAGHHPAAPDATLTDRGVYQAAAALGFALHLSLENFLGYRREFLPARGLIVRNAHIGKPRVRRGVF